MKILAFTMAFLFLSLMPHIDAYAQTATDITGQTEFTLSNGASASNLRDNNLYSTQSVGDGGYVDISSGEIMGGIYIKWQTIPGSWELEIDGSRETYGQRGFLHEYIDLSGRNVTKARIHMPAGGHTLNELDIFSEGEVPEGIQVWQDPLERADFILFTTHSDDEQLYFAGIMPYYAIERKARIQVVYMTHHWESGVRPHELLDGLWTVGIRNYPIISPFRDDANSYGTLNEPRDEKLVRVRKIYDQDAWIQFQVEQLRRFKPQVVLEHDFYGEYGHGAHVLNADSMVHAMELANSEEYDNETLEKYGTWQVKKAYFHLYPENEIIMDWDTPYESMGGKTPFEMTKTGFDCHPSQHGGFLKWLSQPKATDIVKYSPCKWGLYLTNVGSDIQGGDMLENIELYSEIEAREEAERIAAEEAAAEAARIEAERRAQLEAQREEEARALEELEIETEKSEKRFIFAMISILMLTILVNSILIAVYFTRRRNSRKSRKEANSGKGMGED